MIIFTDAPILAGSIYSQFGQPIVMFNLSSLYSGYNDVTDLITTLQFINTTGETMPNFVESVEFDRQLAGNILGNDKLFCEFMSIMVACDNGYNVIVLVQKDPYRDAVMESIIKLIQQRYGYGCWIVEDAEDLECVHEYNFTPSGRMALDEDLQRYYNLTTNLGYPSIYSLIGVE